MPEKWMNGVVCQFSGGVSTPGGCGGGEVVGSISGLRPGGLPRGVMAQCELVPLLEEEWLVLPIR